MTARLAERPMTGIPIRSIEVRVGFAPSGAPRAAMDSNSRSTAYPLSDPEMVRNLIADLQEALEHLQGGDAVIIPRSN